MASGLAEHTAHGELGLDIQNREQALLDEGKIIKGRQIMFSIQEKFKTDSRRSQMYNITHLAAIEYGGDELAAVFKTKWDKVLLQMKRKPDPEDLKILFADQLRKSKKLLDEDIAHFDRVDEDHADHSYEWLYGRLMKHINDSQIKENTKDVIDTLGNKKVAAPGALTRAQKKALKKEEQKKAEEKAAEEERKAAAAAANAATKGGGGGDPKGKGKSKKFCIKFQEGRCEYGSKCRYVHEKDPDFVKREGRADSAGSDKDGKGKKNKNGRAKTPPRTDTSNIPCSFFAKGTCKKGDQCNYSHAAKASVPVLLAAGAARGADATKLKVQEEPAKESILKPILREAKEVGKDAAREAKRVGFGTVQRMIMHVAVMILGSSKELAAESHDPGYFHSNKL